MSAYYNEHDPFAAAWLRELIKQGHIADGVVDERSIEDVTPADLKGFTQCHFFAGIGGWSYALRLAGWADDRPVWTGSCPCQPFSAAGKGGGFDDERHLWPAFQHLIAQCKPPVVFGEQVASKATDSWIDLVHADLEAVGYAFGGVPFPSAGVGAPHIRDRNFWVAEPASNRRSGGWQAGAVDARPTAGRDVEGQGAYECWKLQTGLEGSSPELLGGMADAERPTQPRQRPVGGETVCEQDAEGFAGSGVADGLGFVGSSSGVLQGCDGGVANAERDQEHKEQQRPSTHEGGGCSDQPGGCGVADPIASTSPTNGFWRNADWLFCRDGKWRPVEPGTFPLAHGVSARVGRLRGYGNAINAEAAKIFIEAYLERS